jgi:glycosyltransferase involved in cell wall biosynthesis
MRVAVLGPYPWDPVTLKGGVEAVIAYLVQGLSQFPDLDVHIITLCDGLEQSTTVDREGFTVHYVPAANRLANVTFFARSKLRLHRILNAVHPDLIHAHIAGAYAQVAFRSNLPAVLTLHGIRYREATLRQGFLNRVLRRHLVTLEEHRGVRAATNIIAISPYILEEFGHIIRGNVYHIENPIAEAFFDLPNVSEPNRLLFAGRIIPGKGILILLQAIEQLKYQIPDVQLRLAGGWLRDHSPTFPETVIGYIRDHDLQEHIHILGQLEEGTLLQEYARCAALVLPSLQETAPMVIAQAMAAGKAVVATRVGGTACLVDHGRTGLLVEPGDTDGLVNAMTSLLTDVSRLAHMGEQGRIEANRRFRTALIAAKTYEVYQQILEPSQP